MARPLRIEFPGAFYHVTSRGNEKKDIFRDRSDRLKFLSYLASASERYGAKIHVFCLMNNHYHLLLETPLGNLSQIMHHLNGAYTAYFNRKRERAGHLFQGRYKAILVDADAYMLELSRYVHLNPVRVGYLQDPARFEWSSFAAYAGVRAAPSWLNMQFVLSFFNQHGDRVQKAYQEFVMSAIPQPPEDPLRETFASTVLGRKQFIEKVRGSCLGSFQGSGDLPSLKAMKNKPSIKRIVGAVNTVFCNEVKEAKRASLYFCHRFSGVRLREIGAQFGIADSAVSRASRRFSQRLKLDKRLQRRAERVENLLEM